jgi:predicted nucleic acid-binding protein
MSDAADHADAPDPTRVVADADVLAADLLIGGDARRALDTLRAHSWLTLVASDPLLDDAEAVVRALADDSLATDWRERIEAWREPVEQPPGDHPGLASAHAGDAPHLLSSDERLTSATGGANLRKYVDISVRTPTAFAAVFDPERLWPTVGEGAYPGPDRDPRA